MTADETLEIKLRHLGERSGDLLWPLPLWEEYDYILEANFADIPNLPVNGNPRYAGAIAGGKFLQQFADTYPFAHLDIAPRMTSGPGDHLAKGAAGTPVRLFLQIAENF
jgi:leucyl aminopeptidase